MRTRTAASWPTSSGGLSRCRVVPICASKSTSHPGSKTGTISSGLGQSHRCPVARRKRRPPEGSAMLDSNSLPKTTTESGSSPSATRALRRAPLEDSANVTPELHVDVKTAARLPGVSSHDFEVAINVARRPIPRPRTTLWVADITYVRLGCADVSPAWSGMRFQARSSAGVWV
jgi:hypothetical protein